jgi:RNA polymerase sigma factor (TIGR02999 family)
MAALRITGRVAGQLDSHFHVAHPLRISRVKCDEGCDKLVPASVDCLLRKGVALTDRSPHEVTQLLQAWSDGDHAALEKLVPLVYGELHRLAKRYMARERPGHLLQTTELVNEVYFKLIDSNHMNWRNRAHFFAVSAELMRRILVDYARSRRSLKRGAELLSVSLDEAPVVSREPRTDLVALDDALNALAAVDPRKSQVVQLRFFGGLSVEETAEVLKVSADTVMSDWKLAKLWLLHELRGEKHHAPRTLAQN